MSISFTAMPKVNASIGRKYVKPRTTANIKVDYEKPLMSASGYNSNTNPDGAVHDQGAGDFWGTGAGGGDNW